MDLQFVLRLEPKLPNAILGFLLNHGFGGDGTPKHEYHSGPSFAMGIGAKNFHCQNQTDCAKLTIRNVSTCRRFVTDVTLRKNRKNLRSGSLPCRNSAACSTWHALPLSLWALLGQFDPGFSRSSLVGGLRRRVVEGQWFSWLKNWNPGSMAHTSGLWAPKCCRVVTCHYLHWQHAEPSRYRVRPWLSWLLRLHKITSGPLHEAHQSEKIRLFNILQVRTNALRTEDAIDYRL